MRFRGALQHIIGQVLTADPCFGPVYIGKVELAEAYIRLWTWMEDVLSSTLLIPN